MKRLLLCNPKSSYLASFFQEWDSFCIRHSLQIDLRLFRCPAFILSLAQLFDFHSAGSISDSVSRALDVYLTLGMCHVNILQLLSHFYIILLFLFFAQHSSSLSLSLNLFLSLFFFLSFSLSFFVYFCLNFHLLLFTSNTKLIGIQTPIASIEGKQSDDSTTTTVQLSFCLPSSTINVEVLLHLSTTLPY